MRLIFSLMFVLTIFFTQLEMSFAAGDMTKQEPVEIYVNLGNEKDEIKFFPKTGMDVGNVVFAIFAQISPIGVDDRGGVVINTGLVHLVNGNDQDQAETAGRFHHQLRGGAVRNFFSGVVPAGILLATEIRTVKNFLQTNHLAALGGGLLDHGNMLFNHGSLDFIQGRGALVGDG